MREKRKYRDYCSYQVKHGWLGMFQVYEKWQITRAIRDQVPKLKWEIQQMHWQCRHLEVTSAGCPSNWCKTALGSFSSQVH